MKNGTYSNGSVTVCECAHFSHYTVLLSPGAEVSYFIVLSKYPWVLVIHGPVIGVGAYMEKAFNPLPTNDTLMCHGLSIKQSDFIMGGLILGVILHYIVSASFTVSYGWSTYTGIPPNSRIIKMGVGTYTEWALTLVCT